MKNFPNSIKKWGRKLKDLIYKKPPKFEEKIRKKTNYLLFCILAYRRWKFSKTYLVKSNINWK